MIFFVLTWWIISIIKTGNSYHGEAKCSWGKFCSEFSLQFLSILFHISSSIEPITLIWAVWVSFKRSFSHAKLEYINWVMPSLVKGDDIRSHPLFWSVTASTGVHGSEVYKRGAETKINVFQNQLARTWTKGEGCGFLVFYTPKEKW